MVIISFQNQCNRGKNTNKNKVNPMEFPVEKIGDQSQAIVPTYGQLIIEEEARLKPKKEKHDKNLKKKLKKQSSMSERLTNLALSSNMRYVSYAINIILGQLGKFSLYNNVCFIITSYYCELEGIALVALIVVSFNVMVQFFSLFRFIVNRLIERNQQGRSISTKYINDLFTISIIGRNNALAQILDTVAPFNVSVLPNNSIMRNIFPYLAGRSISNSVKEYLLKFAFEDVPQIILQLSFISAMALRDPSQISVTIYITIVTSIISLLTSFIKFMSIRPSSISQTDFDNLDLSKQNNFMDQQLAYMDLETQIIKSLSSFQEEETISPL